VYIATAAAIIQLWARAAHLCCSAWVDLAFNPAYGLSNNNNGDDGCGWWLPVFGGLTAQVDWLGLRVGSHPALSLHSSDEPGELSK